MTCFLRSKGKEEHARKLYHSRCYYTPGILKFGNIILLPSFCCGKSRCYSTSTAKKVLKT
jgi:hypothetical protein